MALGFIPNISQGQIGKEFAVTLPRTEPWTSPQVHPAELPPSFICLEKSLSKSSRVGPGPAGGDKVMVLHGSKQGPDCVDLRLEFPWYHWMPCLSMYLP